MSLHSNQENNHTDLCWQNTRQRIKFNKIHTQLRLPDHAFAVSYPEFATDIVKSLFLTQLYFNGKHNVLQKYYLE